MCRGNNIAYQRVSFMELFLKVWWGRRHKLGSYFVHSERWQVLKTNPDFQTRLLSILEQTLSNLHSHHARKLTRSVSAVLDPNPRRSYIVQHRLFEFPLNLLALFIRCRLAMKVKESTEIEFWRLQKLYLPNMNLNYFSMPWEWYDLGNFRGEKLVVTNILERIDALCGLLNLPPNDLGNEFGG